MPWWFWVLSVLALGWELATIRDKLNEISHTLRGIYDSLDSSAQD